MGHAVSVFREAGYKGVKAIALPGSEKEEFYKNFGLKVINEEKHLMYRDLLIPPAKEKII